MKTIFYFFLFLISLLSATWSLFSISSYYMVGGENFFLLFALTFLSLAGSILFGYAFMQAKKNN